MVATDDSWGTAEGRAPVVGVVEYGQYAECQALSWLEAAIAKRKAI